MLRHMWETLHHKLWVARFMLGFALRLVWRAAIHDISKFSYVEAPIYARANLRRQNLLYGFAEYTENLKRLSAALEHHYRRNRHHPEHHQEGVWGMHLLDLVEMLCDWQAAAKTHASGDIHKSIEFNRERFNLCDGMVGMLRRSVTGGETGS